jgi:two-component system cell cycle response regulator DivK
LKDNGAVSWAFHVSLRRVSFFKNGQWHRKPATPKSRHADQGSWLILMQDTDKNTHTILVVDDFEELRTTLKMWLEKRDYRVVEARDGEQAIEVARRERPALILMDLGMPERSGLSATYKIRKDPDLSDIPIVAVTAYGAELRADALKAGCVECLDKPLDTDELHKLLDKLLQGEPARRSQNRARGHH